MRDASLRKASAQHDEPNPHAIFAQNPLSLNILHVCNPTGIHDIKWVLFFSKRSDIKQFVVWEERFDSEENQKHYRFFSEHGITVLPSYPSFSVKKFLTTLATIKRLNALIKEHNIDVIHILFTTPHSLYVPFLKAPAILTTRGSDILKVIPGLKNGNWKERILFSIFKRAFKNAAYVTTTSQKQVDWVEHLFAIGDHCRLIRTGVDIDTIAQLNSKEYLPKELSEVKFIFLPRWMFPQYNVETQIAAIKLLSKDILTEYTFVFIHGKAIFMEPDDYFFKMREEIKKVEGLKYIIFDRLTQMEVWACFKETSLTVMVPHTDGTPNTALEAMSARSKLIMGDADYDNILFDDTCIRVVKTDAPQLARAIETALKTYPEGLLDYAFSKANQYGNRTVEMNKVLALYQSIVAR